MDDPGPSEIETDVDRTRSKVVNVLMAVAAGVAASGWLLRDRDILEAPPGGTVAAHRAAMMALVGLAAVGYATLRIGTGRPGEGKYRVAVALLGALAVPLGLVHGWYVDPSLKSIVPFWVAALGLGALAFPRGGRMAEPTDDERGR